MGAYVLTGSSTVLASKKIMITSRSVVYRYG